VSPQLILNSYAKLNLYLAVLNKRPDDYHNLDTVFERISLADRITLKPLRDREIKIATDCSFIPRDDTNLACRAARLLQGISKLKQGIDIKIQKRIPVGSGMGGGSSNAACVLTGLNQLWKLGLSQKSLAGLAKKIGSDVPFFIYDCAFAHGSLRGDKIRPLRQFAGIRLWHIVVMPKIKVSTPFIYEKWDEYSELTKPTSGVKILLSALRKKDFSLISKSLFNSLEKVTSGLYPEVRRIKEVLRGEGLQSILMSGSGPAVFGILPSRKEAVSLNKQLSRKYRCWQFFVTHTM
jgi:4-diphosphocytidyl-2-C-methyl-D-erythritol kinase